MTSTAIGLGDDGDELEAAPVVDASPAPRAPASAASAMALLQSRPRCATMGKKRLVRAPSAAWSVSSERELLLFN